MNGEKLVRQHSFYRIIASFYNFFSKRVQSNTPQPNKNFLSPVVTSLIPNLVKKVATYILYVNGYKNDRSH